MHDFMQSKRMQNKLQERLQFDIWNLISEILGEEITLEDRDPNWTT